MGIRINKYQRDWFKLYRTRKKKSDLIQLHCNESHTRTLIQPDVGRTEEVEREMIQATVPALFLDPSTQ